MPDLMVSEKVEMSWRYACRRCRRDGGVEAEMF